MTEPPASRAASPAGAASAAAVARELADRVASIQAALRDEGIDGWLLYDFHGANPIAPAVLGLDRLPERAKDSRRWFYLIPARGTPRRIVHRIEPRSLDPLPGDTTVYLAWDELDRAIAEAIGGVAAAKGAPGA
ncbi:MAG TPA: hypothetical protein VFU59_06240, partial [Candidatus Eisenbacteria bacterium]|nr:hypothetical protein [Candidatus Eisenbacteria bacterium]